MNRFLLALGLSLGLVSLLQAATLEIDCLDIGQGDCTLIVSPTGRTMLMDAGDQGKGYSEVLPYLNQRGIDSLDFMIASHYHQDHIGGLDEVISGGVSLGVAYDRGDTLPPPPPPQSPAYYEYVASVGQSRTTIQDGQVIDLGGGATARCVSVSGNGVPGASSENDLSVALVVSYGGFDFFIGGDLSGENTGEYTDIETSVAPEVGDIEVFRVNHHGSKHSSNQTFLDSLRPAAAVISVGQNGSGLPAQEAIDRIVAAGSYLYLTESGSGGTVPGGRGEVVNGDIVIVSDGIHYAVNDDSFTVDGYGSDTIPPAISDIAVSELTSTQARISWRTDEPADSRVRFGVSPVYDSEISDSTLVLDHSLVLSGLESNTLYHYSLESSDASANRTSTPDQSLTTNAVASYPCAEIMVLKGSVSSGNFLDLAVDDGIDLVLQSTLADSQHFTDWSGEAFITENPSDVVRLICSYDGSYSSPQTQYLYLHDFQNHSWVLVDFSLIGVADSSIIMAPPEPHNFISTQGEVGLRVLARGQEPFLCQADYLSFQVETPGSPISVAERPAAVTGSPSFLVRTFPNPFRLSTTILFQGTSGSGSDPTASAPGNRLPAAAVYDIAGRMVRGLNLVHPSPRIHSAAWDGRDSRGHPCPSGIYLCRVETANESHTERLILIR